MKWVEREIITQIGQMEEPKANNIQSDLHRLQTDVGSELSNSDFSKDSQSNTCALLIATVLLLSWWEETAFITFSE